MKASSLFLVVAAAAVIALVWLVRHPLTAPTSSEKNLSAPAPEAKKTPPASKRLKHKKVAAAAELAVVAPDPSPEMAKKVPEKLAPAAPAPRPFPELAQIPVGVDAQALARFREPTFRTISAEHGLLKETYVYCPGGMTDTWVRLNNGKVVEKYKAVHTPNGYDQ